MRKLQKIWIIEDHKYVGEIYRETLEELAEIEMFQSISEFSAHLSTSSAVSVDLIIADLNLPDGHFLEFYGSSRGSMLQNIPVIVISATVDEEDIARSFELGATDFLSKPVSSNELLFKTKRVLVASAPKKGLIKLNVSKMCLSVSGNETEALTSSEYKIIVALLDGAASKVHRDDLSRLCSGGDGNRKILNTHISNLRLKINSVGLLVFFDRSEKTYCLKYERY